MSNLLITCFFVFVTFCLFFPKHVSLVNEILDLNKTTYMNKDKILGGFTSLQ